MSQARAAREPEGTGAVWPRRIGILNDYVRIPYANGSSFASQHLYRELGARGHDVTILGPSDPDAEPGELPAYRVELAALPLRMHPGVRLPLPTPAGLARAAAARLDLVLGQTSSELLDLGVWLRARHGVPYLCVNTIHLPSTYNVLLTDRMLETPWIDAVFSEWWVPSIERHCARIYNDSDGLIVLSQGLESYWRERGVTAPIHVIPRAVEPAVFDRSAPDDPFPSWASRGRRLLMVCRHTREKGVTRLLRVFAEHVAPHVPDASLTIVGDGPDHDAFRREADRLGVGHRTCWPGEVALEEMPAWYRHADVFTYTSLSETYGQVVSEAMWCGLPVVAFEDGMGVSSQIRDREDGLLIAPGPDRRAANERFARSVRELFDHPDRRAALAAAAAANARRRADPERCMQRYQTVFRHARVHHEECRRSGRLRPGMAPEALRRWTLVQAWILSLGCLRPPQVVKRHDTPQPTWDRPFEADAGVVGETGAVAV